MRSLTLSLMLLLATTSAALATDWTPFTRFEEYDKGIAKLPYKKKPDIIRVEHFEKLDPSFVMAFIVGVIETHWVHCPGRLQDTIWTAPRNEIVEEIYARGRQYASNAPNVVSNTSAALFVTKFIDRDYVDCWSDEPTKGDQ